MPETISILDGSTLVVSDSRGDIDAGPESPHGLFQRDTRFLSRWQLSDAWTRAGVCGQVFAGYERERTGLPVEYPTASSPQAWATGTPAAPARSTRPGA